MAKGLTTEFKWDGKRRRGKWDRQRGRDENMQHNKSLGYVRNSKVARDSGNNNATAKALRAEVKADVFEFKSSLLGGAMLVKLVSAVLQ